MIVVLMGFGVGMAQLRSVAICFTKCFVSPTKEREGTFGFESAKR